MLLETMAMLQELDADLELSPANVFDQFYNMLTDFDETKRLRRQAKEERFSKETSKEDDDVRWDYDSKSRELLLVLSSDVVKARHG